MPMWPDAVEIIVVCAAFIAACIWSVFILIALSSYRRKARRIRDQTPFKLVKFTKLKRIRGGRRRICMYSTCICRRTGRSGADRNRLLPKAS